MILEDGRGPGLRAANGQIWRCVSDQVMGGESAGTLVRREDALHLSGSVSLANNGGFLQMALDLAPRGAVFDASGLTGLALTCRGRAAGYNLHLRSADMSAVWQSWRAGFEITPEWQTVELQFAQFQPHRTPLAVDPSRLTRLGLVAIGREMQVDFALKRLEWLAH